MLQRKQGVSVYRIVANDVWPKRKGKSGRKAA
jgi:hypothetical protein